jgi:hypothetical protein
MFPKTSSPTMGSGSPQFHQRTSATHTKSIVEILKHQEPIPSLSSSTSFSSMFALNKIVLKSPQVKETILHIILHSAGNDIVM